GVVHRTPAASTQHTATFRRRFQVGVCQRVSPRREVRERGPTFFCMARRVPTSSACPDVTLFEATAAATHSTSWRLPLRTLAVWAPALLLAGCAPAVIPGPESGTASDVPRPPTPDDCSLGCPDIVDVRPTPPDEHVDAPADECNTDADCPRGMMCG